MGDVNVKMRDSAKGRVIGTYMFEVIESEEYINTFPVNNTVCSLQAHSDSTLMTCILLFYWRGT